MRIAEAQAVHLDGKGGRHYQEDRAGTGQAGGGQTRMHSSPEEKEGGCYVKLFKRHYTRIIGGHNGQSVVAQVGAVFRVLCRSVNPSFPPYSRSVTRWSGRKKNGSDRSPAEETIRIIPFLRLVEVKASQPALLRRRHLDRTMKPVEQRCGTGDSQVAQQARHEERGAPVSRFRLDCFRRRSARGRSGRRQRSRFRLWPGRRCQSPGRRR